MNVVPSLRGKHSARYLRNPFHAHVLPALELPIHLTNEVLKFLSDDIFYSLDVNAFPTLPFYSRF